MKPLQSLKTSSPSSRSDNRIAELELALRVIHIWAGFALGNPTKGLVLLEWIKEKAEEALK